MRFNFPHTLIHESIRKTKYEGSSSKRISVRSGDENDYRCPMNRVAVASKHNALDERMRFNRPYAVIAIVACTYRERSTLGQCNMLSPLIECIDTEGSVRHECTADCDAPVQA